MTRHEQAAGEWFHHFDESLWLKSDETGVEEAQFIIRTLALKNGHTVLDVPCGAGRIAVHLAKAGCQVTGVDLSPEFVARARRRLRRQHLPGRFLRADMRELDFEGKFDAVIIWGGSFGYFSDLENLAFLTACARALRSGGALLIDDRSREWTLRHFRPKLSFGTTEVRNRWSRRTQRMESAWTWKAARQRLSCRSSIRLHTPGQYRRLFARAGLQVQAIYGNLDGHKHSHALPRIYVFGRQTIV